MLHIRASQSVVYLGVWWVMCARVNLRVSPRRLAVRTGGGGMVLRGSAPVVDVRTEDKLTHYQTFPLIRHDLRLKWQKLKFS
jgi:hypothetical protein